MSATVQECVAARRLEAERRLRNFRGVVHRKGTTGWVDRGAAPQFRRAFEALVAFEDLAGIEAAGKLADRLREVRVEAMARGLLTATQVRDIEREEIDNAGG